MPVTATESPLAREALAGLLRATATSATATSATATSAAASSDDVCIVSAPPLLNTRFAVADAAAAALAATGVAAAQIQGQRTGTTPRVTVNRRRAEASLLSFALQRFTDPARAPEQPLPVEDRTAAAGFYPTRDGRNRLSARRIPA